MLTADYNRCVNEFSDPLYRFILKSAKDREMARDVVQEAFARMWEKRHDIDGQKAKSYLFTTGYHCMIDILRREKRNGDIENVTHEPIESRQHHSDLNAVLHEALERLPEIQRSVILLRDYEGYNYSEIGEICNLSESQVKVYIFRARKALKTYIGKMEVLI
jgi:RNA polymerase sigma factor (sigma-70 family)